MKRCTNCDEPASFWQRDLFTGVCRKCRKAEADENPLSLSHLTLSGWLLTFVTIGVMVGIAILLGAWLYERVPVAPFRRAILGVSVIGGGLMVFALVAVVLNRLGLPVWRSKPEDEPKPQDGVGEFIVGPAEGVQRVRSRRVDER
jgi:hypothetical protein